VVLFFLTIIIDGHPSVPVLAAEISGTVALPSGTATVGGVPVRISIWDPDSSQGYYSTTITIPAGDSSQGYSLTVSDDPSASLIVSYFYNGDAWVQQGYYASGGTVWRERDATRLPGGQNHAGNDLTLLPGNTISGNCSLPQGESAPIGGTSVQVSAYQVLNMPYWVSGTQCRVTIPEGENSTSYSMTVIDSADLAWRVEYFHDDHQYVQNGYYTGSGTTWNRNDAAQLPGHQDHNNVNLALLIGNTISGTVRLATGTAPVGGVSPTIIADNINGEYWEGGFGFATIDEGESSVPFSVVVPINVNASWRIEYWCWSSQCKRDFYRDGGYTADSSQATLLAGGQDYTGIQLILDRHRFPWNQFLPIIINGMKRSR